MFTSIPDSMKHLINEVSSFYEEDTKIQSLFKNCFSNTYLTTLKPQKNGTTFVITGDIPAMWLRDSAAQVRPYLVLAEKDMHIADMIEGVINKQMFYITHDPYANAFNETANGERYSEDKTEMSPLIWERKYEVDSLCYPLHLSYLFWKSTGRTSHFNKTFLEGVQKILDVWEIEQNHEQNSNYRFEREDCRPQDTLTHDGKGSPVGYTGMTWSGFRPSDDACEYGYLIPSNMFAVVVLKQLIEINEEILHDKHIADRSRRLAEKIEHGIKEFGIVEHPKYGRIFAYETDGLGNYNLMDDANVPSLLSIPYLGYCTSDDPVYQNTRRFILSSSNPYFYKGKVAEGIGSPHTPEEYIWHISLAIQGITASTEEEKQAILSIFKQTDGNTNFMHEGFHVDDPEQFTREWFSWANAMFSEFILHLNGINVKGSPLVSNK
ncbi:metal-independent alpha-mannosidase [Virgibacillus halodenitrificans]|uniref:glycoside hydrolase family 125 protein n=1 Tax=Virgibacillus halodenitrificans TaxID=1482 RepID=UPI00136B0AF9|nr:glycoside hydrolase family 125 protein [Virgibacillus halodenitrificans]MYL45255.1 metal-independent alpha-mannosidase [Virgibacillus halodenitrificans]